MITPLTPINLNQKNTLTKNISSLATNQFVSENKPKQKIYASTILAYNNITFGNSKQSELLDEYNWYINNDRVNPFNSLMKIDAPQKDKNELFLKVLQDDNLSFEFINNLASAPRELNSRHKMLATELGAQSPIANLYAPNSPYHKAFEKFMDKKYNEARSIESLIKLRPDWKEELLIDKFQQLTGRNNFEIGNIPKEFPNDTFGEISRYLNTFNQYGFKMGITIPPLDTNGHHYEFESFTEGKSPKNVYGVYTQGKKFIFKIDDSSNKGLNKPFALGTLALIDNYLTLNRCRNSAPIYYYNHDLNTSIYKYVNHNKLYTQLQQNQVNSRLPDFQELGLCYNDTLGSNNYFLIGDNNIDEENSKNNDNELISVDNDHVTYSKTFMLKSSNYNIELPNAMQTAF